MIKLDRNAEARLRWMKPNVVGAVVLIALAAAVAKHPLSETEMQKASGLSYPGWKDNREAVLAALRDCFDVEPKENAA